MKKSVFAFLILFIWLSATTVNAQRYYDGDSYNMSRWHDYQRGTYFGLRLGLNVPTLRFKGTSGLANTQSIARFNIGLVCGQKLGNGLPFFVETGLLYSEKGTEINATDETGKRLHHMRYLEIPLVIKYKVETNVDDLTVQPFFGGFMAVGIAGQTKCYDTRTKISPFGNGRFKRFDSGIRLGCGMAFQNFYLEMSYDIGLFNIANTHYTDYHYDDFDGHIRTGCLSTTIGIDF